MNAWKLNGYAGHYFRKAIIDVWEIPSSKIYQEVVNIDSEGHITRRNGKVYKLTLTEVIKEKNDESL